MLDDATGPNHPIFKMKAWGCLMKSDIKTNGSEWPMSHSIEADDWLESKNEVG